MMNLTDVLTLKPAAERHIQSVIESKPDVSAFRLSVKTTGCNGYMYVSEVVAITADGRGDDEVLEGVADFPVYIAKDAVAIIRGTVLDYIDQGLGMKQLVFDNPNVAGQCGCGESFNLKEGQDE